MAPPKKPYPSTYRYNLSFLLLLSTVTFSAAVPTSRCSTPNPTPEHLPDGDDTLQLLRFFQISTGYFSGGVGLFASDDPFFIPRSFSLFPHKVARTTDRTLLEVTATLTLSGPRSYPSAARQPRHRVSFYLHGYYHEASSELCMVGGSGSYSGDDGSIQHLRDVNLHLRLPNAPNLSDPFVTGRLDGADFETISLVAYAESDHYVYSGKKAFCPPPTSGHAARGALQALEANFSCPHLRELLISSYKLEYGDGDAYASSSFLLRQHELRMHVNQMHCTANGSVRAYVVFSNDTEPRWWYGYRPKNHFLVKEEAVVADGYWDSTKSQLCLRACRVVHPVSGPSSTDHLEVGECGIGMNFWFPAVWTIRDRSVTVGLLWNASQGSGTNHAGVSSGVISASSIDEYRSTNLSDVKYNYTLVEKANKQYLKLKTGLRNKSKKGRFPGNNTYSYEDFKFHFFLFLERDYMGHGRGRASPVTIGPVMVDGDRLAAEDMFFSRAMGEMNKSQHAVAEMDQSQLLNVSYDIVYHVPPANWQRPKNGSYSVRLERRQMSAEGVYDPKTGILCMIGCRELNGSTDSEILVTVQFASLDAKAQGHGGGRIRSQRDTTDRLYFEAIDITLYGMYTEQMAMSIWRMDLESIMVVISTTLSCMFTVLQIRHTKRNPEAPPAMSIAMLVLLALGYITPLVLNAEALFMSRRKHYVPLSSNGWLELNEVMLRVPTLIVFVLQLRLLQMVWLGRRTDNGSKAEALLADEKKALRICLPLYLLGGVVAGIVHLINGRAASMENPLVVRTAAYPATLWEDLMSYAGVILDGFLLPQVIQNAFSGSRVEAISPWFYVGGTMIRAMPHVYDVFRAHNYVPSLRPSYIYADPRDDLFGVAWDIVIPLGAALLALLLFLQQRLGGAFLLCSRRRSAEYEMVSTVSSPHEVEKALDHRQEDAVTD